MENDFGLDLQDIFTVIDSAEVIIIRLQIVEKRVLVDARRSSTESGMISLVQRAGSSEERFRGLKRLRPRFPVPDRIMSFQWPRQVASLKTSGVWERLAHRLVDGGSDEMARRCDEVFEELLHLERQETIAAIRGGEGYETVWERKS
ncbi:MAG TPA: hypothetical protein VK821_07480 [Dehalococcoidia bacterium]|nr:hypothetical protein [Dehalococcoidia bacterium]